MRQLNILILIVEDDKYMNEILREVLEDEGYTIDTALNAVDALIKIKHGAGKYNILILDYNLDDKYGITGLDVFETAKKVFPGIEAIMISAYGEKKIKEMCANKGISEFIDKPFLVSNLLNSIKKIILNSSVV